MTAAKATSCVIFLSCSLSAQEAFHITPQRNSLPTVHKQPRPPFCKRLLLRAPTIVDLRYLQTEHQSTPETWKLTRKWDAGERGTSTVRKTSRMLRNLRYVHSSHRLDLESYEIQHETYSQYQYRLTMTSRISSRKPLPTLRNPP